MAAGRQKDRVNRRAGLVADVAPRPVEWVGLHHRAASAAVGVVVHLILLVGGVVADLVRFDADVAALLCAAENGFVHHVPDSVGKER